MPDLSFRVTGAEGLPFAAQPTIALKLNITNANPEEAIHGVNLRVQIQIEATRRQYGPDEKERLLDLFGQPERWSRTLRPILWTHISTVIPAFTGSMVTDLQVHCTFDFNVGATKYFHATSEGDIPLLLLFSGTAFYASAEGTLQVAPISWDKEARYRLPASVWREMMDLYYPNSTWLSLRRDVFEHLYQYKMQRSIATWEEALENLLAADREAVRQ
ncbi:MAG: hypothetical protein JOZ48_00765 [Acidobacteriaceae bacterium]|nr:hypothetical protein [Acidobacteriaceae bacterium]